MLTEQAKKEILVKGTAYFVRSIHSDRNPDYLSSRASYIDGVLKGYEESLKESDKVSPGYTRDMLEEYAICNYEANQESLQKEKNEVAVAFAFGFLAGFQLTQ